MALAPSVNTSVEFDPARGTYKLPARVLGSKRREFVTYYARHLVLTSTPRNQTGCFIDLDPERAERAVSKANRDRCSPPLEEKEIHRIFSTITDQAPDPYLEHWTNPNL